MVEVSAAEVSHRITVIEVVRYHKAADILHNLLGPVGHGVIIVYILVIHIVLEYYAFILLKCLKVTFAYGLENLATNLLCHFLWQDSKIPAYRCFDLKIICTFVHRY